MDYTTPYLKFWAKDQLKVMKYETQEMLIIQMSLVLRIFIKLGM